MAIPDKLWTDCYQFLYQVFLSSTLWWHTAYWGGCHSSGRYKETSKCVPSAWFLARKKTPSLVLDLFVYQNHVLLSTRYGACLTHLHEQNILTKLYFLIISSWEVPDRRGWTVMFTLCYPRPFSLHTFQVSLRIVLFINSTWYCSQHWASWMIQWRRPDGP